MSTDMLLKESIEVPRPPAEAFAYVSDFTSTVEWDATVKTARKISPGVVAVGTVFEVVCALPVGSVTLLYTVEELQPDSKLVLYGKCRFFTVRDTVIFTPSAQGTRIDYLAQFEFASFLRPVIERSRDGLERMGRESVAGLQRALEDRFSIDESAGFGARADRWVVPGISLFSKLGYSLARKHFQPMSASVHDKHMIITGASTGLGYAAAMELARRGARLTLVMRDESRAKKTLAAITSETGNESLRYELADLSSMAEVDALARRLRKRGEAVDVLINNAGALFNPRQVTPEGLEQSFALLLLSPYRLTEGLRSLLALSAAPRVINVVSGGMYTQQLQVDELADGGAQPYSGSTAYAHQKRALMVLTQVWAERWAEQGIAVNAMHPGWADTPGVQGALPEFRKLTQKILRTAEQGADTIVWLAAATEGSSVSGKLFLDRQIHSPYLLRRTVEPEGESARLMDLLENFQLPAQAGR